MANPCRSSKIAEGSVIRRLCAFFLSLFQRHDIRPRGHHPLPLLLACALGPIIIPAQIDTATISGIITDQSGAIVVGAEVRVTNADTNAVSIAKTNSSGIYTVVGLKPGRYNVKVVKEGFNQIDLTDLTLNVQDDISRNFTLRVGSTSQSISVEGSGINVNTTDGSVSTVIDRQFVENIPLNGRSFQSLILLTPGVTSVPNAGVNATGEFSINGQRPESNYYTVDGVSANTGMADLSHFGVTPQESALGTTQSLVSVDALQEFRINTSSYSAEFGRMPGGQISFQTRSGTNSWHGTLFDYFRNDALDANNWFNDAAGFSKTAERQNDFGGTLGGPIEIPGLYNGKDKTFFFFSYEGLHLTIPQPAFTIDVPDATLRQTAPAALQPILNAFPVSNGAEQGDDLALFTGDYSTPSNLNAYSIRIDHTLGSKLKIFGRYSDTPSKESNRQSYDNPAIVTTSTSDVQTVTIGATSVFSATLANEFRFNYTWNNSGQGALPPDSYGGASPLTLRQLFPGISLPSAYFLSLGLAFGTGPGITVYSQTFPTKQWNVTDSLSSTFGAHTLKYGIDYRRISGTQKQYQLADQLYYYALSDVLSNSAPYALVFNFGTTPPTGEFTNFSAFVQDEWRLSTKLRLSLGLRWEFDPPPTGNPQPYTLNQITNLDTAQLAPAGTPMWQTEYHALAPRIGLAYQLRQNPGHETVFRVGFGVFYDVTSYDALNGITSGGVGDGSLVQYPSGSFPFTPSQQTLPPPSTASPYNAFVNAPDPHLRMPYTLQWNAAIEQGLGANQTLTISYVAAAGRKLIFTQYLVPANNPNFALGNGVEIEGNGSTSSYNSLQVQYQRRLSHGLQALASYTWAHSIDDLSTNQLVYASLTRGNSSFDIRHNFSGALTYDVPGHYANAFASALLDHWSIDLRQSDHSALPIDIDYGFSVLPTGQYSYIRPDMVPGVPVYVSNPLAPGGRVVNINAFAAPAGINGNEPRNFVRGFAAWQTDLAIRREFPLHEKLKLQFRAESFNLFNHPNFGQIQNSISAGPGLFGYATGTLNNYLGGLNPLYQTGGPRSLQLALKLIF